MRNDKTEDTQQVADHQKRMMRLQEEKEEEQKRIVKTERERMRKELRRKEWHYSVAFRASLVGFIQEAKCCLRVQLRFCPNIGGCWYPTATAVRGTGSTVVRQQPPRMVGEKSTDKISHNTLTSCDHLLSMFYLLLTILVIFSVFI